MNASRLSFALLAGGALLGAVAWAVHAARGGGAPVTAGVVLGTSAGLLGSALETLALHREMRRAGGRPFQIVGGAAVLRLAILLGGALLLNSSGFGDAASFALCMLASFLASLPAMAVVTLPGRRSAAPGSTAGRETVTA